MGGKTVDAARTNLMRLVKKKDTSPELILRKALYGRRWRYRLHMKGLAGTPDIVFPRRRVAVFVHGCFWHGHACRLGRLPKTRIDFWHSKIASNRARDERKTAALTAAGWRVIAVWQCALTDAEGAVRQVEDFLNGSTVQAEVSSMIPGEHHG